jgi:ABC-2 type transport system permease protein
VVAQLVRLKLTLLVNGYRRSAWQTVGVVLGSLYALSLVALVVVGAVALGTTDPQLAAPVLVLGGAVLVLGWLVVPVFAYGVDATLDPHRFVTYPIPRRRLLAGLAAGGVVSVPGIATALALLGATLAWWRSPATLAAALVGAVAALALCVVGSRALTTLLAPLLESRRSREVLTVAAFVPIMLAGPAIGWFSGRLDDGATDADAVRGLLGDLADVVAWTPLGAPWGVPAAVRDGDWGAAAGRLAVLLATLALAWWVWDRALARTLETPAEGGAKGARGKGLGWFDRFPATPTGAVAARAATYWLRDPRYSASVAIIPLLPVVLAFAGQTSGEGPGMAVMLILAPLTAWVLGFSISNDIAYDHTAFALHVATGTTGRTDRWGRALPVLVAGTPLVTLFALLSAGLAGRWSDLPALLGLSLGTLALSTGVSSAVSAHWLYPVPKPGESPFKQPQGAVGATMVAQGVAGLATFVLSLPALALALVAILLPSPVLGWVALVVGPAVGVVVLVLGVRWGARAHDRRAPELLQRVLAYA